MMVDFGALTETLDARVRLVEAFGGLLVHNKGCLGEAMLGLC
jgi:hypothetical protein